MSLSIRNCRFAFRCDRKWDSLKATSTEDVRYCSDCQQEVHWCSSDGQLAEAIALNRCVAIEVSDFLDRDVVMGLIRAN